MLGKKLYFMRILVPIFFFACLIVVLHRYFIDNVSYYQLDAYVNSSDEFRAMEFGRQGIKRLYDFADEHEKDRFDVLTTFMIINGYLLDGTVDKLSFLTYQEENFMIHRKKPVEFQKLCNAYESVLTDLKYFPIPRPEDPNLPFVSYENSWGSKRTYGGERQHEGTDIMADNNIRGYFPVVSMTDGVIQKVGWLEQGGYRLGIRAPQGAYFYYAHLYGYSQDFKEGDTVKAGELIGYMGDTGYSKIEGTTGNFDVHLHLGIYITTDNKEETSVNPYWILKYLEDQTLVYSYGK